MADNALNRIQKRVALARKTAFNRIFRGALGKIIAKDIKTRTRLGRGVDRDGGSSKRLKKLSEKYKAQRKKMDLSSSTTASKSNLTKSGQLLDSLTGNALGSNDVEVTFKENRDDGKRNSDIVGWQEEQDRPFFHMTKQEKTRATRVVSKRISQQIRKTLK